MNTIRTEIFLKPIYEKKEIGFASSDEVKEHLKVPIVIDLSRVVYFYACCDDDIIDESTCYVLLTTGGEIKINMAFAQLSEIFFAYNEN